MASEGIPWAKRHGLGHPSTTPSTPTPPSSTRLPPLAHCQSPLLQYPTASPPHRSSPSSPSHLLNQDAVHSGANDTPLRITAPSSSNPEISSYVTHPSSAVVRDERAQSWPHHDAELRREQVYFFNNPQHSGRPSASTSYPASGGYAVHHARHQSHVSSPKSAQDVKYPVQYAHETARSPRHSKVDSGHYYTAESKEYPAHAVPPPFPTAISEDRLMIRTIRTYDLEAADHQNPAMRDVKSQTLPALVHLGLFATLLSLAITIYTLFILFGVVVASPFRLCIEHSKTFKETILSFLVPPLNLQRRCIRADPVLYPPETQSLPTASKLRTEGSALTHTKRHSSHRTQPFNITKLVVTNLLSPFLALPLAICALITGLAWLPSAMIIHEETAGVTDDERRMAERLVGVWYWWLDWCRVEEETEQELPRGRRRERGHGT